MLKVVPVKKSLLNNFLLFLLLLISLKLGGYVVWGVGLIPLACEG
jgi:hypothetical protein